MNVVPKLRTIFGFAFGGVMYKLLLVSDKEEIRSLYRRYAEWNTLGFEQPDVAENAQQGIDLLSHRRYDAISSLLSVSEGKKFFAYLSRRPEMLGMETARDEEHLRREISTARRALSTRDASRQSKQVDDYTKVLQGEFFCDLLRGAAFDGTKIDERMQSLKLDALDAARPVVTSSFRLPQGDYRTVLDKLIAADILRGRSGTGEERVLDLTEDSVRLLVLLDRAGAFGS